MEISWNLKHLYENDDDCKVDFERLTKNIEQLDMNVENSLDNADCLYNYLKLNFSSGMLVEKLYCFAKRHLDIDLTLVNYQTMMQDALDLYNKLQMINNKFENNLINNYTQVYNLLKNPKMKPYERFLNLILRKKEHIVSSDSLDKSYLEYMNNMNNIKHEYQLLFDSEIQFQNVTIDGEEKELNTHTYNDLIMDSHQSNRKTVYDEYTKGYKRANQHIFTLYIDKLKLDIHIAKKEHYNNLLEKKLFELELPNEIVENLIKTVNSNLEIMHQYSKLKKTMTRLKEYHIYDSSASICEIPKIEYSLDETISIIKNSLNVLGDDYIAIIDKIFDEGWIDIYPKDNKRAMSFTCISYVGVPYILVNFNKSINSVRTMAHEIGHAIHTYYSKNNNPYEYFEYSFFLAEIASKVNEILLNEYMLKNCQDIEVQKYILNNIISSMGNSLFGQMMLTEFEHNIITKIGNNEILSADYLNEYYFKLSQKYNGNALDYDENIKYDWSKVPHFIMQDTYYLYQYAIGISIATNIAYRILNNEENFVSKYKKFLSLGNSVSIKEALKYIDIDLTKGDYIQDTINALEKQINKLEKLYR